MTGTMKGGVLVGPVHLLERRVMAAREAARQLRIPPATLVHWLEGGERAGIWYQPVLREEPQGTTELTWGEVVEARYLRAYRQKNVSMQQLRPFISKLRQEFGVPYPLAHFKPYVDEGRRLLLEIQEEFDLPEPLRVVYEVKTGQLILDRRLCDFLDRVDFAESDPQEAERLYPAGKRSPVVMDPRLSGAAATVRGIRTANLAELADAQVPIEEIAEEFGLPLDEAKAALSYEWSEPGLAA